MEPPEDQANAPDAASSATEGEQPAPPETDDEAPAEGRRAGKKLVALLLAALLLLGGVLGYRILSQPAAPGSRVGAGGAWTWTRLPFPPIDPRYGHAAVWTGSKMIVWGGFSGVAAQARLAGAGIRSDGAEFDPRSGEWTMVPPAPISHRPYTPAVWTGEEMVTWGGDPAQPASLIAYNAVAKSWRVLPPPPLGARGGQSTVWTGTEIIIWGGSVTPGDAPAEQVNLSAAGAVYNLQMNSWREIPPAPIAPRDGQTAIWTGKEMLVWGGTGGDEGAALRDGGAFDLAANTWTTVPAAPEALEGTAAWSGKQMLIWGDRRVSEPSAGRQSPSSPSGKPSVKYVMQGLAYSPGGDRWRKLPAPPFTLRTGAKAVWAGERLFVWGGLTISEASPPAAAQPASDGAVYDPGANHWEKIAAAPIKGRDFGFSLISAGDSIIVWGGKASERGGSATSLADGARLSPARR